VWLPGSRVGRSRPGWGGHRRRCRGSWPETVADTAIGPRPPTPRPSAGPSAPKPAKLVLQPRLRAVVEAKLALRWSPQQIAGWLPLAYPQDPVMRVSHEKGVPEGTKTITMYVSDLDQSEIPGGQAYQLSIRHPDGSTQQLDISEQNYRDLKLAGVGKTLKKRGRKPGSTTAAAGVPRKRRPRQNSKPPATA
jgi:hypothetical protein